ncbi:MAG: hypothetical protein AAF611_02375 [Bacteroidota bacterium]
MKYFPNLIVLLVASIFINACSKTFNTDWDLNGLQGKVKTVTENQYKPEKKEGTWFKSDKLLLSTQSTFTSDGYLESIENFDRTKELKERSSLKIENGKIQQETRYDLNGKPISRSEYIYVSATEFEISIYNEAGEKVAVVKNTIQGDRIVKRTQEMLKDGENIRTIKSSMEYNTNRHLVRQKDEFPNGNIVIIDFEYLELDAHRNWIKRLDYAYLEGEKERPVKRVVTRTYEYY